MNKKREYYYCSVCGNIVKIYSDGGGEIVCCGEIMRRMEPKNKDSAAEKHVPVVRQSERGFTVNVGSIPHPMSNEHQIKWIELTVGDTTMTRFLSPDDDPEARFCHHNRSEEHSALEYCNLHGLWKS